MGVRVLAYGFQPTEISHYRMRDPLAEIKRQGLFEWRSTEDMTFPQLVAKDGFPIEAVQDNMRAAITDFAWADVLFTARYTNGLDMKELKPLLDKRGIPWVLDIDDHVLEIDRDLAAYETYMEKEPEALGKTREIKDVSEVREGEICMEHDSGRMVALTPKVHSTRLDTYYQVMTADALIAGTPELETVYRRMRYKEHPNDKVFTIPYAVDPKRWRDLPKPPPHEGEVWIGWMGADGHDKDLATILPLIEYVLETYPNARFFWKRSRLEPLYRLAAKYPERAVRFGQWVKREDWPSVWSLSGFDIMLAPLLSTPFTDCRSPIKWVEAAFNKVPCVCSRVAGYPAAIKNRTTGYLCSRESQWKAALDALIQSKAHREDMGQKAYEAAMQSHSLEAIVPLYLEAFEEVVRDLGPVCEKRSKEAA